MNNNIKTICENFIANRDAVKKVFSLESEHMYAASACTLTAAGMTADADSLKACIKVLRNGTSAFSNLRGMVEQSAAVRLYISGEPEEYLRKTLACYDIIKKELGRSEYTALLALFLADMTDESGAEQAAVKAKEIYKLMSKDHPLLTGSEDKVMAGFMALTAKDSKALCEEAENCYKLLKKRFSSSSTLQTCSHVLALADGTAEEKVSRLERLFDLLKESGKKYGKNTELTALTALSLSDADEKTLVDTICEIDDFLAEQKGYGMLGFTKQSRLMHAAMLTSAAYQHDTGLSDAASTATTVAMIAAVEMALIAVVICTTATTATAASD
ncbi:DUF4003 family protein [uncultured Ruminococcus sp.]|uniref:DUF4003 family protein n=1 Tax=uncultured Ruminococcus sp. TaxID=165186 RepID=UPI0025E03962|nr:DUF4003 family protein [uncultured Ruminococcus sp.]